VVRVLLEDKAEPAGNEGDGGFEGRAEHQAPEVDGTVLVRGAGLALGEIVEARVTGSDGVDLIAEVA